MPVFDCSHACKPYKSHLALFIISNKSFTRSFSASNDYFPHRTTISYRNAEALYLKLFEIQCFSLCIIPFLSFQISCLFTIPALLIEYRLFNRYLYFFLMGECIIPFLFCLSLLISTFLYHGLNGVRFLFLSLQ